MKWKYYFFPSSSAGPANFFAALFLLDVLDNGLFCDHHDMDDGGWDDRDDCDEWNNDYHDCDNDYNDYD